MQEGSAVCEESKLCELCGGSGIVSYFSEHPNLRDQRFCPECLAGWALVETIFQIVVSSRED